MEKIRIAVDAMGGDHAPREVVHGAVLAAKEWSDLEVLLVGAPDAVEAELARHGARLANIKIVPASEVIGMDEKPSRAILKKKDSSIVVATKQVADGLADGIVAAGSTGAAAVAAQLGLGRITNVDRSAIACTMPSSGTNPTIMLDVGANVDCTPFQLLQFGLMGVIVCEALFGTKNPKVAILNIGTEETKGNELVQGAYRLFKENDQLNFTGFIEGRDFPMAKADVVVTDGFTGNVTLKTAEGIAKMIGLMLKQELHANVRTKIGGKIAEPAFDALKRRIDYSEFGGALLVGVKGVYVIAHGGSTHTAIKNAIRTAREMVVHKMVERIEASLSKVAAGSTAK
ncbi:MAG: phosphate acyltransferase PlsX [Candidatus Obscuribacterales bacterium]